MNSSIKRNYEMSVKKTKNINCFIMVASDLENAEISNLRQIKNLLGQEYLYKI